MVGAEAVASAPLAGLDTDAIRNVFIYVCDALRWDFRPEPITQQGVTFRTAVHGTYTPTAMASLMTGRYPPRHGVVGFDDRLPTEIDSAFDIDDRTSSLRHNQWDGHPIFDLLGQPVGTPLEDLEAPFIYVEHDHGAHAPYPSLDGSVRETFAHVSNDRTKLHDLYREGIAASVERFEDRVVSLRERGLADETLVIFTSDHGELLGEYGGFVGHSLPSTPELAYVPTIVFHPSLDPRTHDSILIEQVDLLPTIRDSLSGITYDERRYDGRSLCNAVPVDRQAYNRSLINFPGDHPLSAVFDPVYRAESVWTRDGGHVFVRSSLPKRVLTGLYEMTRSAETGAFNQAASYGSRLRHIPGHYLASSRSFGTPDLTRTEAKQVCETLDEAAVTSPDTEQELTDETIQRLEDLGYR